MSGRVGTFSFEVRSGLEGLESLKEMWDSLYKTQDNPTFYTDWRWHFALARHVLVRPVYYICARMDGGLVGILPLQLRSLKHGLASFPALSFPFHDHIELSDMVLDQSVSASVLFRELVDYLDTLSQIPWQCLHLRGVSEGASVLLAAEGSTLEVVRRGANAYFDTSDRQSVSVSYKFTRNINRLKRKAEVQYGAAEVISAMREDELVRAFEAFLEIEASGWKGAGGTETAILRNSTLVDFYGELLKLFSTDGSARVNLLLFGSQVAAGQLCLRSGDAWSVLKIGYQDSVREFGPGNILLNLFIEEACADDTVREINLVTSPEWAGRWRARMRDVYLLSGFRNSLQGRALKLMHQCMTVVQEMSNAGDAPGKGS